MTIIENNKTGSNDDNNASNSELFYLPKSCYIKILFYPLIKKEI